MYFKLHETRRIGALIAIVVALVATEGHTLRGPELDDHAVAAADEDSPNEAQVIWDPDASYRIHEILMATTGMSLFVITLTCLVAVHTQP